MTTNIAIQKGIHTISVYMCPEAVRNALGVSHDGVTFIFRVKDLSLEMEFAKDNQYDVAQLHSLAHRAREMLEILDAFDVDKDKINC